MAYTDENGTITIDEIAAGQDIAKLNSAKEDLGKVRAQLQEILNLNSDQAGPTADTINEITFELLQSLDKKLTSIDESIKLIQSTLAKYREIDRRNKAMADQMGG